MSVFSKPQLFQPLLPLAIALCLYSSVHAADEMADAASATELPAVTVTARKSAEIARELPFAISVIDGDDVQTRRLLKLEDALRSVPGVDVSSWGGFNDANVRIRGVGSMFQISMEDSSVLMNLDGVPLSSRNATLATLDIERIEILKGPQSTLFGNSQAGAVNVISRRPSRDMQGHVRAEAGQDGQILGEAAIGGPLSNTFSARVALRSERADSYLTHAQNGKPLYTSRDLGGRVSLLWQPNEGTSALLIAERQNQDDRLDLMQIRPYGKRPQQDFSAGALFGENIAERYSLEINHDLTHARLTTLTSWIGSELDRQTGYDRVLAKALYNLPFELLTRNKDKGDVLQQDVRLTSLPEARVFWMAGFNFLDSQRTLHRLATPSPNTRHLDFKTLQRAVYGEVTWPTTEALKLTVGLRHTRERKTYDGRFMTANVLTASDHGNAEDHHTTGRLALNQAVSEHSNLYAVIARGHKSSGFTDQHGASLGTNAQPYKPSTVNSGEIGFKHESANRRLSVNAAVFWNTSKDDHLLGFDYMSNTSTILNANTQSRGAEMEAIWQAGGGWSLRGGLSVIDAEITDDVPDAQEGPVASGNRMPDIPRFSANLGVDQHRELPPFWGLTTPTLSTSLTLRHMGARANDAQNHFRKLDLRIGLASGNAEAYLWADNLLDTQYDLYGYWFTPALSAGMPARGRTAGVGFSWVF